MPGDALRSVAYLVELVDELVVVDVLVLVAVVELDDAVDGVLEAGVVVVVDAEVRIWRVWPALACA
eukprot:1180591-Amphidinium_carterae.2